MQRFRPILAFHGASADMDTRTTPANTSESPEERAPQSVWEKILHGLRVRWRWLRRHAVVGIQGLGQKVDHWQVMKEIEEDGLLTGRYVFMVVMSCAIAILGLLLSSPAVVIGAMLISPLMGPIMLMGFSLCALDYAAMRKALVCLGAGVMGALAISIIIVMVSPLREATPEILARTRPNLFDLLVAVFSGLAGGYSVIHRKGGTIVGVAIATALMPPLAVVGFGVATASAAIAGGALFLFMTNLLAIALSVTGLAWLHGFATVHSEKAARWQTGLVLAVFVGLSLPLGFALRDIAYETRVQNVVREEALRPFTGLEAEVSGLSVTFPRGRPIEIHQTVITHERIADAEARLKARYEAVLRAPVNLSLNQVVVDEAKPLDEEAVRQMAERSVAPLQRQLEDISRRDELADDVRLAIPFNTLAIDLDPAARTASIVAAPNPSLSLAAFRGIEQDLSQRFPSWRLRITPPMQDLPQVRFEAGQTDLSAEGLATLNEIRWALERWGVTSVIVSGNASLGGDSRANDRIALRRAEAVAGELRGSGLAAVAESAYGASGQAARQRQMGSDWFQSASVRPAS
ncbi:MAG TPA: DUF389 domain-containing protein [Hyphomonadaceae bacterium]|nr:DUF389 domain-containing protein [Hyphomonadaceae bacterium]